MVHLITGYKGHEHIKSADQGRFNASFYGTSEYVMESGNQCQAQYIDNNTVRILDGDILMQGRHISIEPDSYEDLTITTGTSGYNRADLIVMTYKENEADGIEDAYLEVIKGTEATGTATLPTYTSGNILAGATYNQMPLYRVDIVGVTLQPTITPLFKSIPTFATLAEEYEAKFIQACENHLDSLNILDSLSEIQANTTANQMAGALAVKELGGTVAGKASLWHDHNDTYYTKTQTDTKLASKSNLLTVATKSNIVTTYSIEYGASKEIGYDVSKSGYTPIGIVGYELGSSSIIPFGARLSGTTAILKVKNVESGSGTVSMKGVWIDVLYVKN